MSLRIADAGCVLLIAASIIPTFFLLGRPYDELMNLNSLAAHALVLFPLLGIIVLQPGWIGRGLLFCVTMGGVGMNILSMFISLGDFPAVLRYLFPVVVAVYVFFIRKRLTDGERILVPWPRLFHGFAALVMMYMAYIVCALVFFPWHLMGQWPVIMAVFGAALISIAAFCHAQRVLFLTPMGYLLGYWIGEFLQSDTWDINAQAYSNNMWIIWTLAYLGFIAAGVVWEVIAKKAQRGGRL
jgi:hypothetical protein